MIKRGGLARSSKGSGMMTNPVARTGAEAGGPVEDPAAFVPAGCAMEPRTPVPTDTEERDGREALSGDLKAALGTVIHNAACSCLGRGTGLMLRESDCNLMADAVIEAGFRLVVDDDTTVERVARALVRADGHTMDEVLAEGEWDVYPLLARAAVRALREEQ